MRPYQNWDNVVIFNTTFKIISWENVARIIKIRISGGYGFMNTVDQYKQFTDTAQIPSIRWYRQIGAIQKLYCHKRQVLSQTLTINFKSVKYSYMGTVGKNYLHIQCPATEARSHYELHIPFNTKSEYFAKFFKIRNTGGYRYMGPIYHIFDTNHPRHNVKYCVKYHCRASQHLQKMYSSEKCIHYSVLLILLILFESYKNNSII